MDYLHYRGRKKFPPRRVRRHDRSMRLVLAILVLAAACGEPAGNSTGPDGVRSGTRLRAKFRQEAGQGTARELVGWHDQARDEDCGFTRTSDGMWRCLPPVQWSEIFADETCTTPLGTGPLEEECWAAAPYVGRPALDVCHGTLEAIFEIGPRTLPATVYLRDPETGACAAAAPDAGVAYFAAGTEVGLDQFGGAHLVVEESPARLDQAILVGEDGARAPLQVRDGDLGVRCHMWLLPDEELWHCLPLGNGIAYWADAACSVPVATADVACVLEEPFPFVSQTVTDACGFTIRVFERGPELEAPTLYRGDAASCAAVPAPDDEVWYQVGPEVPRETLAQAAKLPGDETGRLRGNYLVAEDGFRRRAGGFVDTERGEECIAGLTTDRTVRCLPVDFGTLTTFYADAACTEILPVFEQTFPACKPPPPASFGIEYVVDGCDTLIRPRAVGAELAPGAMYQMGAGGCEPRVWDATTVRYYPVGAELPLDDFVELVPVTE